LVGQLTDDDLVLLAIVRLFRWGRAASLPTASLTLIRLNKQAAALRPPTSIAGVFAGLLVGVWLTLCDAAKGIAFIDLIESVYRIVRLIWISPLAETTPRPMDAAEGVCYRMNT
jgi:hypothetical protein